MVSKNMEQSSVRSHKLLLMTVYFRLKAHLVFIAVFVFVWTTHTYTDLNSSHFFNVNYPADINEEVIETKDQNLEFKKIELYLKPFNGEERKFIMCHMINCVDHFPSNPHWKQLPITKSKSTLFDCIHTSIFLSA